MPYLPLSYKSVSNGRSERQRTLIARGSSVAITRSFSVVLDAPEIPTSEVRLGDKVWIREHDSGYEFFEVVGFGADDAPRGLAGAPFVDRYGHDGDYSWNGNNYIDSDICRIVPRGRGRELDESLEPSSLRAALEATIEKRGSGVGASGYSQTLSEMEGSAAMAVRWRPYGLANPYASSIARTDVVGSIRLLRDACWHGARDPD